MAITRTYQPMAAGQSGYGTLLSQAAGSTQQMERLQQIHSLFAPLLAAKQQQASQQTWQTGERTGEETWRSGESAKDRALQEEQARLQREHDIAMQKQQAKDQFRLQYPQYGMTLHPTFGWISKTNPYYSTGRIM